jgi:rSAM/selenodomain-associated transferase 1
MAGGIPVAIMAKVPAAGQVKTRLCPPLTPVQAAGLAACFLRDRVEQLAEVPEATPVVAFAPPEREPELRALLPGTVRLVPQQGADLGARLDRLLADLLGTGGAGAIAIDADSPTLPTGYLRQACAALGERAADVVLGPCDDGGYYLVGLREPMPELFRDMPWSTSSVLGETVARARRLGRRVTLLPPWFDVDRGADLDRLWSSARAPGAYRPAHTLAYLARELRREP